MYLFKKNKNLVTCANNAVLTSTFILLFISLLKALSSLYLGRLTPSYFIVLFPSFLPPPSSFFYH